MDFQADIASQTHGAEGNFSEGEFKDRIWYFNFIGRFIVAISQHNLKINFVKPLNLGSNP